MTSYPAVETSASIVASAERERDNFVNFELEKRREREIERGREIERAREREREKELEREHGQYVALDMEVLRSEPEGAANSTDAEKEHLLLNKDGAESRRTRTISNSTDHGQGDKFL